MAVPIIMLLVLYRRSREIMFNIFASLTTSPAAAAELQNNTAKFYFAILKAAWRKSPKGFFDKLLLFLQHIEELLLRQNRDPKLACLAQLAARILACHDIRRLLRDGAGGLAAVRLDLFRGLIAREQRQSAREHECHARKAVVRRRGRALKIHACLAQAAQHVLRLRACKPRHDALCRDGPDVADLRERCV